MEKILIVNIILKKKRKKMKKNEKIFILLGPTASGKSDVAYKLIQRFTNLQIINCDSKQVYKEIPKITAQPHLDEILQYNYKLYGHRSVYENYNISQWLENANDEIEKAFFSGKTPLLVGGTGFYINGLMNKMSDLPQISEKIKKFHSELIEKIGIEKYYEYVSQKDSKIIGKIHPNDKYRLHRAGCVFDESGRSILDFYEENKIQKKDNRDYQIYVVLPEKDILYQNIEQRFHSMMQSGILDEISQVMSIPKHLPSYKSHGLPELIDYINGEKTLNEAIEIAIQNTRNYAKRQKTWFKNQIRDGFFFHDKDSCLSKIHDDFSFL